MSPSLLLAGGRTKLVNTIQDHHQFPSYTHQPHQQTKKHLPVIDKSFKAIPDTPDGVERHFPRFQHHHSSMSTKKSRVSVPHLCAPTLHNPDVLFPRLRRKGHLSPILTALTLPVTLPPPVGEILRGLAVLRSIEPKFAQFVPTVPSGLT